MTPSFACWFRDTRSLKGHDGSFYFQFNRIFLVSPGGSLSPSETKTSRPAECKVMETGSKNLTKGLLGIVVCGTTPLTPGPVNCGSERNNTIYWKLIHSRNSFLEKLSLAQEDSVTYMMLFLSPQKAMLPFCQGNCIRMVGTVVIPVNSISMSPLLHFFAVRWVPWSETVIWWKPWWWISPLMVVWADALHVEKGNSYPE